MLAFLVPWVVAMLSDHNYAVHRELAATAAQRLIDRRVDWNSVLGSELYADITGAVLFAFLGRALRSLVDVPATCGETMWWLSSWHCAGAGRVSRSWAQPRSHRDEVDAEVVESVVGWDAAAGEELADENVRMRADSVPGHDGGHALAGPGVAHGVRVLFLKM